MNIPIDLSNTLLQTKRLILRPWKTSDLYDLYEYASVDGVGQMAGWTPHKSIVESQDILDMFISEKHVFALELFCNHKVIGSLGLENITVDLGEPYTSLMGREIGYVLGKDYWGQGFMPEAVHKAMEYCFEELNCDFLQCCHEITNDQSRRVIEKSGFQYIRDYEQKGQDHVTRHLKVYMKKSPKRNDICQVE